MISLSYFQVGLIMYCLMMYFIGWFWYIPPATNKLLPFVAWAFSPILVPLGLAFLFLTH